MKIKPGFTLRQVCGYSVICATGLENINFNKIINLNETAAKIFEYVRDKDFDASSIAAFLKENYPDVGMDRLFADSEKLVASWVEAGITED